MNKIKTIILKIIIIYVIFILILSCISCPVSLSYTSAEVGSAIAGYAKQFVEKGNTGTGSDGRVGVLRYTLADTNPGLGHYSDPAKWSDPNPQSDGMYWTCCATFVSYMYELVAGLQIRCHAVSGVESFMSANGSQVSMDSLQPGDVLFLPGVQHVGMYIGNNQYAHSSTNGNAPPWQVYISDMPGSWQRAYRISNATAAKVTHLNTTYTIGGTGATMLGQKIDYSYFFFNGIPDGTYSLASRKSIFEMIIDAIKGLINYITGLLTYLLRGVIISFISIFDRLLNNTIKSVNDSPQTLQESGVSATSADDPTSINRSVTIEGIVFNDIDLFDINIFKVD